MEGSLYISVVYARFLKFTFYIVAVTHFSACIWFPLACYATEVYILNALSCFLLSHSSFAPNLLLSFSSATQVSFLSWPSLLSSSQPLLPHSLCLFSIFYHYVSLFSLLAFILTFISLTTSLPPSPYTLSLSLSLSQMFWFELGSSSQNTQQFFHTWSELHPLSLLGLCHSHLCWLW